MFERERSDSNPQLSPSTHISRCEDKRDDLMLKMSFSSVFQRQVTKKKHPKDRRLHGYFRFS